MAAATYLIVNADDFGRSHGVNDGVITAHEHGIVSSASLMVRWPAVKPAAAYARAHPRLSVGIHIDLGEWVFREGAWLPLYEVVPILDDRRVASEVARQLSDFRRLVGSEPTHLDSHQHVHRREPVRSILLGVARELGVPLRGHDRLVRYVGDFYGQTAEGLPLPGVISAEKLIAIINALPTGVTELGCHPGLGDDLEAAYSGERAEEVNVLCDARVPPAIDSLGIRLCSFSDITPPR
jgi:chitin disaccharide deacetylase